MSVNLSLCNISRACVTCELANKESDGLKSNCSRPCGSVKSTWVEGPQEFPCREDTISYKVELFPDGNILVLYADLPRETSSSLIISLYFQDFNMAMYPTGLLFLPFLFSLLIGAIHNIASS